VGDEATKCPSCGADFAVLKAVGLGRASYPGHLPRATASEGATRVASQPVSAFVFDTIGLLLWAAAIFGLYRQETMDVTVPADGFPNGVANYQLMQVQTDILLVALAAATVGTLFLVGAAIVKQIYKLRITSPGN
jgi:hypothetical protein